MSEGRAEGGVVVAEKPEQGKVPVLGYQLREEQPEFAFTADAKAAGEKAGEALFAKEKFKGEVHEQMEGYESFLSDLTREVHSKRQAKEQLAAEQKAEKDGKPIKDKTQRRRFSLRPFRRNDAERTAYTEREVMVDAQGNEQPFTISYELDESGKPVPVRYEQKHPDVPNTDLVINFENGTINSIELSWRDQERRYGFYMTVHDLDFQRQKDVHNANKELEKRIPLFGKASTKELSGLSADYEAYLHADVTFKPGDGVAVDPSLLVSRDVISYVGELKQRGLYEVNSKNGLTLRDPIMSELHPDKQITYGEYTDYLKQTLSIIPTR